MRLCQVKMKNGMEKAIFHKWIEKSEVIPPSIAKGGHSGGEIKGASAIVEFETGQVAEVYVSSIVFLDTKKIMNNLGQP